VKKQSVGLSHQNPIIMGTSEKFCLRWNDFESNISVAFQELREDKEFFDVTLACDENQVQAHKVILSACSPFFRTVLKRNKHEHPLLYLKGVKYSDIIAVLNFMYHGEVNVAQEELNSFLSVAEDLKVKGLTQNDAEKSKENQLPSKVPTSRPRDIVVNQDLHPPPPLKRARPPPQVPIIPKFTAHTQHDDDIEEVNHPIKTEPIHVAHDHEMPAIHECENHFTESNSSIVVADQSLETGNYGDEYADYSSYEAGYDTTVNTSGGSSGAAGNKGDCSQFMSQIETNPDNLSRSSLSWTCHLCSKLYVSKNAMEDHIRGAHLGTLSTFECKFCGKHFQSRNSRSGHISKNHKLEIAKQWPQ